MTLMLEIVGPRGQQLGEAAQRIFTADGGTIGRQHDCDWIIPDPYISLLHARIHYRDGNYLLEDLSSNGVFVKSRENRLRSGELYFLQDGDRIFLDVLELKVTIGIRQERTVSLHAPVPATRDRMRQGSEAPLLTTPLQAPADAVADALMRDADAFLRSKTEAVARLDLDLAAVEDEITNATFFHPETPVDQPSAAIKDSAESHSDNVDFTAVLLAAGLPKAAITPELSRSLGSILQVVVDGLLDSLRAREGIKSEIGMRLTKFKPAANNPLKFSANAEDALHNLFVKHNAAYLSPLEAFREAFRELRAHQSAMFAAMQDTLMEVESAIDPKQLTQEFDRRIKESSLLPVPAKLRYWDLFCEKFAGGSGASNQSPQARWRDTFSRAYALHFERLRAADPVAGNRG